MWRVMALAVFFAPALAAQIAMPTVPRPAGFAGAQQGTTGMPGLRPPLGTPVRSISARIEALRNARRLRILQRVHRDPRRIALDPAGNPILRGELLAVDATHAALRRARAAGFTVLRSETLNPLDLNVVQLRMPSGRSTARALHTLRRLDPSGTYDFDDLYLQSGSVGPARMRTTRIAGGPAAGTAAGPPAVLGLIDGGIDTTQQVFRGEQIHSHGCGGKSIPSAHGTAVASLMIGRGAHFAGAAPGATLYAANVFCGAATDGSASAIARAFAWLERHQVPVIDISLTGPDNALLKAVIARVLARGALIVAPVGNDGPAAPPLYPAAYPGVIGVTAIDPNHRVLFEACRGPQVMFAAPGADIVAARLPAGYGAVRGTSFAAPLVAGLLALQLHEPSPTRAHAALGALVRRAIHLGPPGRNADYGYGLLAIGLPRGSGQAQR
jgi:subtilisin family serine protease